MPVAAVASSEELVRVVCQFSPDQIVIVDGICVPVHDCIDPEKGFVKLLFEPVDTSPETTPESDPTIDQLASEPDAEESPVKDVTIVVSPICPLPGINGLNKVTSETSLSRSATQEVTRASDKEGV